VPRYFRWAFKSTTYIQALQATSDLVRDGQALRFENFAKVHLPVVPEQEQVAIADYLDRATARIDALVAKTECSIELLGEHRTALITAAVTGKINLRNAA
jgi:type I restriction enzyme S subunit